MFNSRVVENLEKKSDRQITSDAMELLACHLMRSKLAFCQNFVSKAKIAFGSIGKCLDSNLVRLFVGDSQKMLS
jgi:hypothetical protein